MRLALFGDPVAHSRSPAMHAAAFAATGIEGTYEAIRVGPADFDAAVARLRSGALDGANITMPHKRGAADRCDELSATAERLGAVNAIVCSAGHLRGHNTDAPGIARAWERRRLPDDRPVLVLGGGGAARAALLAREGFDLAISTRRPGAGRETGAAIGITCREVPWGEPVADAVVVNATPVGMSAEPLPDGVVEAASGLLDMAYGPDRTPAVALAIERGVPVADGIDLLVQQALRSFELWTGVTPPLEALETAARA